MSNQEALWLDKSGGIKVQQIRIYYSSTNQEPTWLDQSGDITVQPSKRHSVFRAIRRHLSLINQEALLLDPSGS